MKKIAQHGDRITKRWYDNRRIQFSVGVQEIKRIATSLYLALLQVVLVGPKSVIIDVALMHEALLVMLLVGALCVCLCVCSLLVGVPDHRRTHSI